MVGRVGIEPTYLGFRDRCLNLSAITPFDACDLPLEGGANFSGAAIQQCVDVCVVVWAGVLQRQEPCGLFAHLVQSAHRTGGLRLTPNISMSTVTALNVESNDRTGFLSPSRSASRSARVT